MKKQATLAGVMRRQNKEKSKALEDELEKLDVNYQEVLTLQKLYPDIKIYRSPLLPPENFTSSTEESSPS